MLRRLVAKSVMKDLSRLGVAAAAMVLGSALVAALVTLSLDLGAKTGSQLRSYGANLLVRPKAYEAKIGGDDSPTARVVAEAYLPEQATSALQAPGVILAVPVLPVAAEAAGSRFVLVGTRLDQMRQLAPSWKVDGDWVDDRSDNVSALVGVNLARKLGLRVGDKVEVSHQDRRITLEIRGIVESGAAEDNRAFVNLPSAQGLAGLPGLIGSVQVGALSADRSLASTAQELERRVPEARVQPIGQIADAEEGILRKVQLLMGLVTASALVAASLAVLSTMGARVLERRKEMALMKALGGGSLGILALVFADGVAVAGIGGIGGLILGFPAAMLIGLGVFDSAVSLRLAVIPATLGVALLVCTLATLLPARRALALDPAVTLRGE